MVQDISTWLKKNFSPIADMSGGIQNLPEIRIPPFTRAHRDKNGDPRSWLLAAPNFRPEEVHAPATSDLIRLPMPGGFVRLPAFQFNQLKEPRELVLEINRILDAEGDPWGVSDWWLGCNAWLHAIPADLLGGSREPELLDTAKAEVEGV